MKEINVRQLLRNFKSLFPIPVDGIKIIRREGDFYIYKEKKRKTAELLLNKVAEKVPNTVFEKTPSAPVTCDWAFVMSGARCENIADKHVQIASLHDGEPLPTDWRKIDLCSHHLGVIKATNMFSVEES